MSEIVERTETPETALLAVIERAATNPEVDIEKMERLLAMQERNLAREAEKAFSLAMNAAQSEVGRVFPNMPNEQTRSMYADYAQLDRVLRPVYVANGFALSFGTGEAKLPEHVRVICIVSHTYGHTREYHIDMPADGKGAKGGDVMTKTHAVGSATQYGMRYLLKMIFNVAIGRDDDGNAASGRPTLFVSEEQALELNAIIDENDLDRAAIMAWLATKKIDAIEEIQALEFDKVKKFLLRKVPA
jgi:hypothetical protein